MGLFGPTKKGGGLDMRFKSNEGGYLGKAVNFFGSFSSGSSDSSDLDDDFDVDTDLETDTDAEIDELLKEIDTNEMETNTTFDSNEVNDLCNHLDQLLTSARKALNQPGKSSSVYTTQIRSGIMRLKRQGEIDLAKFYTSELNSVILRRSLQQLGIFIIAILSFGGLIFFAFFS
jgi:hypothetical protein